MPNPKENWNQIKIERFCAGNDIQNIGHFPAVTVHTSHDNRVITAFSRCMKKGEVQTQWAWININPSDFDGLGNLKNEDKINLRITSGQRILKTFDDYTELNLGTFTITHKNQEKWLGIVDPNGAASTQVDEENFTFFENDLNILELHSRKEHLCQDVPARRLQ